MLNNLKTRRFMAIAWLMMLSGCIAALPPPQPAISYRIQNLIYQDDFETVQTGAWDTYRLQGVFMDVVDGVYRADVNISNYVWALNRVTHNNAVIEVDAYVNSAYEKGMYGVMCRATPQNDGQGYYFMLSADGNFSIRRGTRTSNDALVKWQGTPAIRQGRQRNRIRAVCIDDYLALYINGQFVADVRDGRLHQGYTGLTVALPTRADDSDTIQVNFDEVRIWNATLATDE